MAEHVSEAIGATLTNPGRSNEASLGKQRILIKSAHYGVPQVGATEATLGRVDAIVASLQDADGAYTLYQVAPGWFRANMRSSRSPRASHVMMARCRDVRGAGKVIGHINPGI